MKKLSLKAKKTIIYVVTVALIVALISGVILSLGVVRAGAYNDEELMLANSAQTLTFTPQDVEDHNPSANKSIGELTLWSGELYHSVSSSNWNYWYFPDFTVDTDDFITSPSSSPTYIIIPCAIIFRTTRDNITQTCFGFDFVRGSSNMGTGDVK